MMRERVLIDIEDHMARHSFRFVGLLLHLVLAIKVCGQPSEARYSDRSILVLWRDPGRVQQIVDDPPPLVRGVGGRVTWVSRLVPGLTILEVPVGLAEASQTIVSADSDVLSCTLNPIGSASISPNDPCYNPNPSCASIQFQDYTKFKPCLAKAWDVQTSGNAKLIAVLDSGVEFNLADMQPNLWHNPGEWPYGDDGLDNDNDGIIDNFFGAEYLRRQLVHHESGE
jgi:hypothetical protein